jgi:hypothetical protein
MDNIKLEFNSFLSDKIKDYNNFVLSRECNKKPNDEILKVYIIENKVLPHRCKVCNIKPFWNKKNLDFLLDRKNNNILDNAVDNLRFLCPNCFSQIKKKKTIFKTSVKSDGIFCSSCKKRIKYKTNSHKGTRCFEEICKQCKTQEKLKYMLTKANNFSKEI